MTAPHTDQSVDRAKPKQRAKQISQWLEFIRPHVDRYGRLGPGAQKQYLEELSSLMGTGIGTLRRFLAAAKYLESRGITQFPPEAKRMPVASIEAIMRIGKRDPLRAQALLDGLVKGRWTIKRLRSELAATAQSQAAQAARPNRIDKTQLLRIVGEFAGQHGKPVAASEITLVDFEFWETPPSYFDRLAYPRTIASLADGRSVAIFDESAAAWTVSPDRTKREFRHNIAMAMTLFELVLVFCIDLQRDIESWRSKMPAEWCNRISVCTGALNLPEGEILRQLKT